MRLYEPVTRPTMSDSVLPVVTVSVRPLRMPPPDWAELLDSILPVTVTGASSNMPPPKPLAAVLPLTMQSNEHGRSVPVAVHAAAVVGPARCCR